MNLSNYHTILNQAKNAGVQLIVVTKNQKTEDIYKIYLEGQRDFAENKVQDMIAKRSLLPQDIRWHMIGHLQKNKIKLILPWIYMIHSVDSFELAEKIDSEARLINRIIPVLLEIKIATELSKYGFSKEGILLSLANDHWNKLMHLKIQGLMGMASMVDDPVQISNEFRSLKNMHQTLNKNLLSQSEFSQISMGMSGDYEIALKEGSTMIRVGSKIFV